ncbi:MAG TPA: hypothetical protein VHA14_07635 [Bryobacteraceae bacterium]|nr:hypothetical protein [Bryobacteraceae bacterium]
MKLITLLVIVALSVAAQTTDTPGGREASPTSQSQILNLLVNADVPNVSTTPADVAPSVAPVAVQPTAAPAPATAKPTLRHRVATVINDILIGGVVVLVWIASGASH